MIQQYPWVCTYWRNITTPCLDRLQSKAERIIEKVDETLPENKELVKDVEEERNKVEEEKKEEVKTDE